jgi:hypothetical protein
MPRRGGFGKPVFPGLDAAAVPSESHVKSERQLGVENPGFYQKPGNFIGARASRYVYKGAFGGPAVVRAFELRAKPGPRKKQPEYGGGKCGHKEE